MKVDIKNYLLQEIKDIEEYIENSECFNNYNQDLVHNMLQKLINHGEIVLNLFENVRNENNDNTKNIIDYIKIVFSDIVDDCNLCYPDNSLNEEDSIIRIMSIETNLRQLNNFFNIVVMKDNQLTDKLEEVEIDIDKHIKYRYQNIIDIANSSYDAKDYFDEELSYTASSTIFAVSHSAFNLLDNIPNMEDKEIVKDFSATFKNIKNLNNDMYDQRDQFIFEQEPMIEILEIAVNILSKEIEIKEDTNKEIGNIEETQFKARIKNLI